MSDPLSVAAGVAGLISLGIQTTQYLVDYYTRYKDRDKDLLKTAKQLQTLLQSLQAVDTILHTRQWRPAESSLLQVIEESVRASEDAIQELDSVVHELRAKPSQDLASKIKSSSRRIAYPFRRSTLEKLNEDVDECRDHLSIALQALELKDHQIIQNDIEDVKMIVKNAQAYQVSSSIRDWLRAPDATVDYNSACGKRHAGSGEWLLKSPAFTRWLGTNNSFLWLYGFAGCGKSILCSTAIEYTFSHQRRAQGRALGFFFFTFNDSSKQDASGLLRALLLQLSGQIPGVDEDLARLKEICNHGTAPVQTLTAYLREAISRSSQVYILLDALDECPIDSTRSEVLSVIRTIRGWTLPGLHLLITSRVVPDIQHGLGDTSGKSVEMKNTGIDQDIRDYVSRQLECDLQLSRWGTRCGRIKDYLTQHAGGVFRWVDCQLSTLRQGPRSAKHLEDYLRSLPRSLDETYERILCNISAGQREEARRILILLCLSPRPLTVPEIIDALAVDTNQMECIDEERKLEDSEDLYQICPGLIDVYAGRVQTRDDDNDDDDEDTKLNGSPNTSFVRIAHFSVQEFLQSDRIKRGAATDFAISHFTGRIQISKICLIYLCDKTFLGSMLTPDLIQRYPMARFAAQFWHHYNTKNDHRSVPELVRWEAILFRKTENFRRWCRLFDVDPLWNRPIAYDTQRKNFAPPLYYAALLGLEGVLKVLLADQTVNVNAQGGRYGNALQAASRYGYETVVSMLLERGADINAQEDRYGSALQAASIGGYEKVVSILLDRGADINAQGGLVGDALKAASTYSHEKVVSILLDRGADINAQGYFGTALQAASARGHEKVVSILLERGANIDAQGGRYGNALQAASMDGYEKTVSILLEQEVDMNAQGGFYGTALQAAREGGHKKVVLMLLERGASFGESDEHDAEMLGIYEDGEGR